MSTIISLTFFDLFTATLNTGKLIRHWWNFVRYGCPATAVDSRLRSGGITIRIQSICYLGISQFSQFIMQCPIQMIVTTTNIIIHQSWRSYVIVAVCLSFRSFYELTNALTDVDQTR